MPIKLIQNKEKLKVDVYVYLIPNNKYRFKLRLDDNLTKIREELAKKSVIRMNEKLFEDSEKGLIFKEDEYQFKLKDIVKEIKENQFEIYLTQNEEKLVDVCVRLSTGNIYQFKLKLDDKLTKIREELEKKNVIKMDEKLFEDSEKGLILEEDEDQFELNDIVKKNDSTENHYELFLKSKQVNLTQNKEKLEVEVSVHLTSENEKLLFNNLRLDDSLTKIREILVELSEIKMDEKLFHSEKKGTIPIKKENDFKLSAIASKSEGSENSYDLFLKENLWKYLNKAHKLDYGIKRTDLTLKRANEKRAFAIIDCHVLEPIVKYLYVKNESKDGQTASKELSFNVDSSTFGIPISFGIKGNKSDETEINSSDETTYNYKKILKFKEFLEPTEDFIKEVKSAIESKNSKKFKEIIEIYGQVIPTEIIMGEKIIKKGVEISKNMSKGYSADINTSGTVAGMGISSSDSKNSTSQRTEESHQSWVCIECNNCVNIFQLLTDMKEYTNLREKIFSIIGKKILYSGIEPCNCTFNGKKPFIGEFEMIPKDIFNMIQDKEADVSVFAVIFNKKNYSIPYYYAKADYFNCQIVCAQGQKPRYIIHRKKKDKNAFKLYKCNLEILYMIVGNYTDFNFINYDELDSDIRLEVIKEDYYDSNFNKKLFKRSALDHFIGVPILKDLDQRDFIIGHYFYTDKKDNVDNVGVFTFSYSLELNKYVNLPFSFYTLKISNAQVEEFNYKNKSELSEFYKKIQNDRKYYSLYSKDNSRPIFLKLTPNEIKLEEVPCECEKKCDFCKGSLNNSQFRKENFDFVSLDLPN